MKGQVTVATTFDGAGEHKPMDKPLGSQYTDSNGDKWYITTNNDSAAKLAKKLDCEAVDLVGANADVYPNMTLKVALLTNTFSYELDGFACTV